MKWSVEQRILTLDRLYKAIALRSDDICAALAADLHKNAGEAYMAEIGIVLAEISYLKRNLRRFLRPRRVGLPIYLPFYKGVVQRVAWGDVLIVAPWNYPFQLTMLPLAGAVAAGNSVTVKGSPLAAATEKIVGEIITAVFEAQQAQMVYGGVDVMNDLLARQWDFIFFTGSSSVGKVIARAAAEHLTPAVLELGGKSPCVVAATANLKLAAKRIVWGKFLNAGQTCVAPDYVMVESSVADEFETLLAKQIKIAYGEDPAKSPLYGRIISEAAFDRLAKLCPMAVSDRREKYIAPTVVRLPNNTDPLMEQEIFGPILPLITYNEIAEVQNYITLHDKPLALYYFGDKSRGRDFANSVSSGGVCINDVIVHLSSLKLPFGGVGASGMGVYHGRWSMDTFSRPRAFLSGSSFELQFRYNPLKHISLIKKNLK